MTIMDELFAVVLLWGGWPGGREAEKERGSLRNVKWALETALPEMKGCLRSTRITARAPSNWLEQGGI